MVKSYFLFLSFWLFLRKVNISGLGIFQASFVTSQLWIGNQSQNEKVKLLLPASFDKAT